MLSKHNKKGGESMTNNKLIGKLLKFKGFVSTNIAFRKGNILEIAVKPYKNGCRCKV
jgi:hypothetical protein